MNFLRYLSFLLFVCVSFLSHAQNNKSDSTIIHRISKSTYVWGFVRYHSVKKANWNKEFAKLYKQAKSCKNDEKLNVYLNKWIEKYYIKSGCDLFIRDRLLIDFSLFLEFPSFTKSKIDTTITNYKTNSLLPEYFFESFEHDDTFPNEEQRVLALNKIFFNFLYFYPYFDISVQKWDSIRHFSISQFMDANTPLKYEMVVNRLLANFRDGHISANSPEILQTFLKYTCPFRTKITKSSAIVQYIDKDSLCILNDIQLNDEILKINGQSINEKLIFWETILAHSTYENFMQIAERYITSDSVSYMKITFKRNDSIFEKSIKLYETGTFAINYDTTSYKFISDTVGWINLSVLKRNEVSSVSKILNTTKVLIIDARGYPNSTIDLLCKWLIDKPKPFAIFLKPQFNCLGEFIDGDTVYTDFNPQISFQGRLIILCDASSVSQSEYSILALKTVNDALLIGENTGGTAGYTTKFYLPGKITCRMPITSFRGLRDTIQGIGIKPDIQIQFPNFFGKNKEEFLWETTISKVL